MSRAEAVTQSGVSRALARLERKIGNAAFCCALPVGTWAEERAMPGRVFKRRTWTRPCCTTATTAIAARQPSSSTPTPAIVAAGPFQQSLGTWLVPRPAPPACRTGAKPPASVPASPQSRERTDLS